MRLSLVLAFALSAAACGDDHGVDPVAPDAPGMGSDGTLTLLKTDWSLDPLSEKYLCVRVTLTEDIFVTSIEPIAPKGTHHAVMMLAPTPDQADGVTECNSSLTQPAIYASGVGTETLTFPDGVGLHLRAGEQLFLNLHLFNSGEETLTGTSGVQYLPGTADQILHEAGSVLAGKTAGLEVVPGESDQVGTCTTPADITMFAVAPHMHLMGAHMKAVYNPPGGGAPTTVLDDDYSFDDQRFRPIAPMVTTQLGGKYVVTCSYDNPTGETITFGESTEQEMCFAMTYVYPAQTEPTCTH